MLRSNRRGRLFLLALALAACSRKNDATSNADASTTGPLQSFAPDAARVEGPTSISDGGFALATVSPVEARRARVTTLAGDPALAGATALLDKQFAGARGPFDLQTTDLTAAGRRAILMMEAGKATSDARPIVIVAGDEGIVWSRERPVSGIMAPVGPIAIAAAPRGRLAMAACDPPTNLVALRIFDDDGSPFADFQALSVDACDAVSLLYWPGRGWIVVAVRAGATRARLVNENGGLEWGQGLDLGARSKPGAIAAASLAADTDETFVLVQMVQPSAAPGSPFHALAFRYDARGTAIWPAAVDLGELPRPPAAGERVKLARTMPGVRVTLPSGNEVDVKPSGDVVSRARAPR